MNENNLQDFKLLFTTMKSQLLERVHLKDNSLEGLTSGDIIDQTTNERDAQLLLKLKGRDRLFLKKIDTALDKINQGTYGECEECGADISLSRLHARPTASFCIHCKEDMEKTEGQVLYSKRSKSSGKTFNHNYENVSFLEDDAALKQRQISSLDDWRNKQNGGISQAGSTAN